MKSNYKTFLIWLTPLILVVGISLYTGLNFGVDYADSNVVQINVSENILENNLKDAFRDAGKVSKIEKFENNSYNIFFQNVNLDKLEEFEVKAKEYFPSIQDYQVYVFEPTSLIMISERVVYGVSFGALVYLILVLWIFKNKELTRNTVVGLVFIDFLNFVSVFVFTAGLLNLLSFLNIQINAWVIIFGLSFLFSLLSVNLNMSVIAKDKIGEIVDRWKGSSVKFIEIGIKYYVLFSLFLISLVFFNLTYLAIVAVYVLSFFYSLFLFIRLKIFLLLVWDKITEIGEARNSIFSKEW